MNAWFLIAAVLLAPPEVPAGSARVTVTLARQPIDVYTYKPADYHDGPLILVFHGVLRNADEYRDDAKVLGDRYGALIAAPRFDAERFPSKKYQQGGLLHDGKLQPRAEWTWSRIPELIDELRRREGRPDMPCYLIGHSGGGQFLVRMAGFLSTGATRIVAANPGSELFPTRDMPYPLGFGGLPQSVSGDEQLKAYLAQPLTLYLGSRDTEQDEYFDNSSESNAQGKSRWERGHNAFRKAEELAKARGWKFGWRLVEAPGVGHDHEAMFRHPRCRVALFGEKTPALDQTPKNKAATR